MRQLDSMHELRRVEYQNLACHFSMSPLDFYWQLELKYFDELSDDSHGKIKQLFYLYQLVTSYLDAQFPVPILIPFGPPSFENPHTVAGFFMPEIKCISTTANGNKRRIVLGRFN
ncbi:hypothetical protein [Alteromonas stellipolaris]|uniref:hypothetical protein n=1 Tax=Alteromonas stellipolaris TaxID=233316 RepID=UPI0026E334AF|nr:hypothetical protein [Alteromonas stellipolaris]MDO6533860.1 hypothetical protein [Alteromonas stellipolaris]MDO6626246.1 hypothetical protein [Alteromonas stellipolaris]